MGRTAARAQAGCSGRRRRLQAVRARLRSRGCRWVSRALRRVRWCAVDMAHGPLLSIGVMDSYNLRRPFGAIRSTLDMPMRASVPTTMVCHGALQ